MAASTKMKLVCVPHPSLKVPFQWTPEARPFVVSADLVIADLMDEVENEFDTMCQKEGKKLQFQINVMWNTKNVRKACAPAASLREHFQDGDLFGIYGEFADCLPEVPKKPETDKLSVTILTGFLGSGKTTLLNYILQEQREKKIAVIENEFGEVSIDDALLKQNKLALAEKIVVMDNGCICCTVRGDLERGLAEILEETKKGNKIDAIIIETTGMADPVPIVRTFMTNPNLTEELRLDGVITLADVKHLEARLDDKVEDGKVNEAYQQIAFADKILLNKLDLVTTDQAIKVKDRIREINKFAKVIPAVRGRCKLDELFNMRAHDVGHFADIELGAEAPVDPELSKDSGHGGHGGDHGAHGSGHGGDGGDHGGHGAHGAHGEGHANGHGGGHSGGHGGGHGEGNGGGHGGGHGEGHGSGHGSGPTPGHGPGHGAGHGEGPDTEGEPAKKKSRHDSRVNSMSIIRDGVIVPHKLDRWMAQIGMWPADKGTIFRIKAILAIKGLPNKLVFHAVMDVNEEQEAGPWGKDEKKVSKIVFIGKGLDQRFLRDGFESVFEDAKCDLPKFESVFKDVSFAD